MTPFELQGTPHGGPDPKVEQHWIRLTFATHIFYLGSTYLYCFIRYWTVSFVFCLFRRRRTVDANTSVHGSVLRRSLLKGISAQIVSAAVSAHKHTGRRQGDVEKWDVNREYCKCAVFFKVLPWWVFNIAQRNNTRNVCLSHRIKWMLDCRPL